MIRLRHAVQPLVRGEIDLRVEDVTNGIEHLRVVEIFILDLIF
jgi:hypothetical protein